MKRPARRPGLLSPGSGSFRFADGGEAGGAGITVRYHLPRGLSGAAPVVFVAHGVKRDADVYRDTWATTAERFGFVLICPEFGRTEYPRRAYQLGNLIDRAGGPLPEDEWTFGIVERLFDFVREAAGNASERYFIYGHSAGAQFVHRLVLFLPGARCAAAVAANAGWYTLPTFGHRLPYGLKGSAGTPERLRASFARRLVILLGERDTDADDPHLRRSSGANRQGRNRLERGRAFYATARKEAVGLGTPLNWALRIVPGAAHFDHQMMPAAARAFFADGERFTAGSPSARSAVTRSL